MASGVEMLGQMSETEALAGPVSGGNMVVKPNEVPVGGAAMLAKALRKQSDKGIGGIYELPSQQAPTPEFMQMAKQNVKTQEAEQRNRYPNNFADDEGGILVLPRNLRTAPGVPQTSLAYITDEEKAILGLLKPGTPHRGPEEVPSYDSLDYVAAPSTPKPTGATQSSFDAVSQGGGTQEQQDFVQNFQQSDAGQNIQTQLQTEQQQQNNPFATTGQSVSDIVSDVQTGVNTDGIANLTNNPKKVQQNKNKQEEKKLKEELNALTAKGSDVTKDELKKIKSLNKKLQKIFDDNQKSLFDDEKESIKNMDKEAKKKRFAELFNKQQSGGQLTSAEQREIKALRDDKTNIGMFKAANALDDILGGFTDANIGSINNPNAMSLVAYKQGLLNKDGTLTGKGKNFATQYGDELDFLGIDDFGSYLEGIKGGVEGTQSQRAIDRKNFYLDNKNYTNATSGQAEQLAGEQLYSTEDMKNMTGDEAYKAEMFNRKVIEAREIASRDRGNNQNRRPGVMQDTMVEEVVETPDGVIDEEAQTMKFTSPRTGDKEVNVPLNRRFRTDPTQDVAQYSTTPRTESDIYKYMTEGTTGEGIGLEPFSEYQRRRRKAMGLEPLGLYG